MSPAPLRAAHVVCSSGATGVEAFLEVLLPSFDRREVDATLFVARSGPMVDKLAARGVRIEWGAPARKVDWVAANRLARRWRGAFDLVHAHGPRAAFWGVRAAAAARVPIVVTLHELRWQTYPWSLRRDLQLMLESRDLSLARVVTVCSDATRRDLLARYPRLGPRTVVVPASAPLLLDADRLRMASPFAAPGRPMRLITVGRYSWQKGYDILFEALGRLRTAGVAFELDVVGHGVEEPELREQAQRLGFSAQVHWLGRDVDTVAVLSGADVFATATRAEMFGIAVLEAMAVGLPVLAPTVGSLPELVEDGTSGRLVPFHPEATLPERLEDVLAHWARHGDEAARLGGMGAQRARERFGPERMAHNFTSLYRELLSR